MTGLTGKIVDKTSLYLLNQPANMSMMVRFKQRILQRCTLLYIGKYKHTHIGCFLMLEISFYSLFL